MSYSATIQKLTPALGAVISGVDLSNLTPAGRKVIRASLIEHGVIFFRDQNLTSQQQVEFARVFGDLITNPYFPTIEGFPELMKLESVGARASDQYATTSNPWHSNLTWAEEPPMGAVLMVREIPANGGGDTMWANTCAAYDALSDSMKRFLSGLTAVHTADLYNHIREKGEATGQQRQAEHPVVRTHPESGRQAIFVNPVFTKQIVQLRAAESAAVLQMLYRHLEDPRFHYRFKWEAGSVAVWDNRATQHRPIGDFPGMRRLAQRATIAGDRPFYLRNDSQSQVA